MDTRTLGHWTLCHNTSNVQRDLQPIESTEHIAEANRCSRVTARSIAATLVVFQRALICVSASAFQLRLQGTRCVKLH